MVTDRTQAKVKININKRAVGALKPGSETYIAWDRELHGFGVKVQPGSGRRAFVFRYRTADSRQQREITLGTFPAVTAEQARRLALDAAGTVAQAGDPLDLRQSRRAATASGASLDVALELYVANRLAGLRSGRQVGQLLHNGLSPLLRRRPSPTWRRFRSWSAARTLFWSTPRAMSRCIWR